jgi:hypothetical protein
VGWNATRRAWISLALILSGCTGVGRLAIQDERNLYNDVIHDSTTEQLLRNIVRAHFYETPSFFDVIEVDQTKTLQASLQGGSANIGATPVLGSLTPTLTAVDSPIIKYQPPSSSGYIQQVVQPIGLADIARLINSDVNISPLLDFSIDRLTPEYMDSFWAIDIIYALDAFGAIRIDTIEETAFKITLLPYGLLTPDDPSLKCLDGNHAQKIVARLWTNLIHMFGAPARMTLTLKIANPKQASAKPSGLKADGMVVTRSALGALRVAEAAEDHDLSTQSDIVFVDHEQADAIRAANGRSGCHTDQLYYLGDGSISIPQEWESQFELLRDSTWPNSRTSREIRTLGHRRAYIIVERSPVRPVDAYVAVWRKGEWFSISDQDQISKKNFALLGNLLIIQAAPPASPATQTVIAAGGTRQ